MKQMKTMMTGMVLCTTLFTACNKAGYDVVPDSSTSIYSQAKVIDATNTSVFSAGYVNAPTVTVRSNGNLLTEFKDMRTLELFELLGKSGFALQPGKYPNMETTIDIQPADNRYALFLRGTWKLVDEAGNTGQAVPVELRINAPFRLRATSDLMVLTDNSSLLTLLNISADKLTSNIQNDMWRAAMNQENGGIVISDQMNPELYNMILKNLGDMLQVTPAGNPTNAGNTATAPVVFNPPQ